MQVKLLNLQALRGFSAVAVVYHHCRFFFSNNPDARLFDIVNGSIGVPVFFIISGFIITYTTPASKKPVGTLFKDFIIRRLIRILPLFYFAVAITLLIIRSDLKALFTSPDLTLFKILFFQPLFTSNEGAAYGYWLLATIWTLNYEMLFYGIFALSLLAGKLRHYALYACIIILTIAVPVVFNGRLTFSPYTYHPFLTKYLNFLTNPILLLFLSGLVLGHVIPLLKLKKSYVWAAFVITITVFTAYIFNLIQNTSVNDIVVCSFFVASVILADMHSLFVPPRWLAYLGNMSYSLYLLHLIFFFYIPGFIQAKLNFAPFNNPWFQLCISLAISFVFSALTFEIIEKRFTNYLKKKLLPSKTRIKQYPLMDHPTTN